MTRNSDFKQVVRARMAETGESYTAARAAGRYRTAARAPERSVVERQEIPAWEAHWLPGFLAGA